MDTETNALVATVRNSFVCVGAPKSSKIDRSIGPQGIANNRRSQIWHYFLLFQVAVDGNSYHRPCFRCSHGGCTISPSNFITHEGRLYCKHHHAQLFMTKGNFSSFSKVEEKHEDIKLPADNKVLVEGVQVA
ncbi:hypothetical protein B296_00035089 [Ensete ventricosum]|uniref:LIM zinc-binding domain-containing protein n=1 Tax=Ensete ventricosum TaxID=4639 RepID=A0A426YV55_ENSVE|nr:hypothetical protein B296_00035089 [Ensete ventricosum]